jgi:hypothetical protein
MLCFIDTVMATDIWFSAARGEPIIRSACITDVTLEQCKEIAVRGKRPGSASSARRADDQDRAVEQSP